MFPITGAYPASCCANFKREKMKILVGTLLLVVWLTAIYFYAKAALHDASEGK